ncbi:DNA helicase [Salmonella phage SD-12_S18]|nr:DNA helicase [Salmonella phage SD-12_S18]
MRSHIYDIHEEKLDALEVFLEEAKEAGKNVFLGYHFRSSRERILARFPDIVEMDKDGNNIKQWNAGRIKVYMAHPQSAGHGLNLQRGGHTILFYDIPYSFENYDQFIGRLDRQGQKHRVTVHHLVAVGTNEDGRTVQLADRHVYNNLRRKEENQDWALKTLRDLRKAMKKEV